MRIADALARKQTFSFEIFPPKGDLPVEEASCVAAELAGCHPDYISVTFSAGGSGNSGSTAAIAGRIQRENPPVMSLAHLTCLGSSRSDVDAYVGRLREEGVENVLALRGDRAPGREVVDFAYASELIAHLKGLDPALCVGAACYPEGHVECEDLARSMEHLKAKQDAGADFLVTQLFFDNELFYRFREACDRAHKGARRGGHHAVHEREPGQAHGLHLRRDHPRPPHQAARGPGRRRGERPCRRHRVRLRPAVRPVPQRR